MKSSSILSCQKVTVSFDGFKAVQEMNLELLPGELRFLIGPNGAGKTTMLDAICGKVKPASGSVSFHGRRARRCYAAQGARDRAARYRPQVPDAFDLRWTDGGGEPGNRDGAEPQRLGDPSREDESEQERIDAELELIGLRRQEVASRRIALARREAVARDRHDAAAGAGNSAAG